MTDKLVERLRGECQCPENHGCGTMKVCACGSMIEAADRIEVLEKVLERIAEYPYDRSFDPLAVMNLTGMAREAIAAAEGDDE